ncbi:molybdopterin-guanine dinucleotide biosynthesis protein MobB, partial [Escherichia coli]
VDDESRKARTDGVLIETIDNERTIRQAERYYIDTNMLQNLPPFVSYIFTATHLPRASLISPLKVKKEPLEIFTISPTAAAEIPDVTPILDFDEEEIHAEINLTIDGVDMDKETIPVPDPHAESREELENNESEKLSLLDF